MAVAGLVKLSPRRIMFSPKGKSYIIASMKPRENPSEAALEIAKDLLTATEGKSASLQKI